MATTAELCRAAVYECGKALPPSPLTVERDAPEGSLSKEDHENVVALRERLESKLEALDEATRAEAIAHLDDFTLIRFVLARDGKLADAEEMFITTMQFRSSKSINELRAELHPNSEHAEGSRSHLRHSAVRNHFHAGWGGCARDGSPFFVENLGQLDVAAIDKEPALFDLMMDAYACHYLEVAFTSVRLASARTGTLQRATTVVDAAGASMSMLSHLRVIKTVAKIGTSYYPEIMKRVIIVNAPWAAAMAWRVLAPFLPEQTRKKVSIVSKNFLPQLLEEIDSSEIPISLGGTREAPNGVPRTAKIPQSLVEEIRASATASEATGGGEAVPVS